MNHPAESSPRSARRFLTAAVAAALAAVAGLALLLNIFERKQEAKYPFFRVVELDDETEDPATWGKDFPLQYDDYRRTVDQVRTRYGGSEALPRTPTQADPRSIVAQSKLWLLLFFLKLLDNLAVPENSRLQSLRTA